MDGREDTGVTGGYRDTGHPTTVRGGKPERISTSAGVVVAPMTSDQQENRTRRHSTP
jgi:hypothetical protein